MRGCECLYSTYSPSNRKLSNFNILWLKAHRFSANGIKCKLPSSNVIWSFVLCTEQNRTKQNSKRRRKQNMLFFLVFFFRRWRTDAHIYGNLLLLSPRKRENIYFHHLICELWWWYALRRSIKQRYNGG